MKSKKYFFIAFICLLFINLTANADTIKLKNGTIVKGKVLSFNSSSFTVALDLGSSSQSKAILDIRDVESIEFDGKFDGSREETSRNSQPVKETAVPRPSDPDDDSGHKVTSSTRPAPANTRSTPVPTNTEPRTNPSSTPANSSANSSSSSSSANSKEVLTVVQAKDDWTYSNLTVRRGDRIHLSASGRVKLSATKESGPEGIELEDKNKLIVDRPTGALIAVIGDDNDDFIYVGRENDFVAKRDGKLFLSVNEGDLTDNNGTFNVRVKVDPVK